MSGIERLDQRIADLSRELARRFSRRGLLARLGTLLAGGAALPLLPVARAFGQGEAAPTPPEPGLDQPEGDPQQCSYWRYCAIDGFLSSCCGGTHTSCPPGTAMSPVTWLGTCRNPVDGRHYVISYNDCCGQNVCGLCFCGRHEGDKPIYVTPKNNDINWCLGTESQVYNSTVAVVVGLSDEKG